MVFNIFLELQIMSKFIFVIGTRPELIKMAPVILKFKEAGLNNMIKILSTAQHKDMLEKYWHIFDIKPDYELNFLKHRQSLGELTSRAFLQTDAFFKQLADKNKLPEYIIVQGDTTTVYTVAVSAFYNNIKIAHIEAGLRTYDLQNPFPEEFNRRAVSIIANLNFSPTQLSAQNLINEGINQKNIHIVGNTVVDALNLIRSSDKFKDNSFSAPLLNKNTIEKDKTVLITFHRRENQNNNLLELIKAIDELSNKYAEYKFVWTVHPNPKIKEILTSSVLSKKENILLTPPLEYMDILKLMSLARIIMSDSGGIQEEAPSFNVPVMVLRKITERPEGIKAKKAFIVDLKKNKIIDKFQELLHNYDITDFSNPYGDGHSAERIKNILLK